MVALRHAGTVRKAVISTLDLNHQFLVSADQSRSPPDWNTYNCSGLSIHAHPKLPVNSICDAGGNTIGAILGWAITENGDLVDTKQQWPCLYDRVSENEIEDLIYLHGGRFVVVITTPSFRRIYVDPAGMLSLVYSAEAKTAGSTVTALAWDEPDHPVWHGRFEMAPIHRPNQFLPGGLTVDSNISRLLPNHYLDLETWESTRHYPEAPGTSPSPENADESYGRWATITQRQIRAIAGKYDPLYITLTAGQDTRLMLACAKDLVPTAEFVTFDRRAITRRGRRPSGAITDVDIATKISNDFRLRHRIVPVPAMTPALKTEYLQRIGYSGGAGKAPFFMAAARQHLDMEGAMLIGHAGEVGWGYYWESILPEREELSAEKLLLKMKLPRNERAMAAMEIWLDGLPSLSTTAILDYLYIEQRLGCWAAPHWYGMAPFGAVVSPFVHREAFLLAHALKRINRNRHGMTLGVVPKVWPELGRVPINSYAGTKGWASRAGRTIRDWARKGKRLARLK